MWRQDHVSVMHEALGTPSTKGWKQVLRYNWSCFSGIDLGKTYIRFMMTPCASCYPKIRFMFGWVFPLP